MDRAGSNPLTSAGDTGAEAGQLAVEVAGTPAAEYIVLDLRLPRLLTALAVSAAFGISGAIFQSLTRNSLGSPDIIGFTAGASTGALIAIITMGAGPAGVAAGVRSPPPRSTCWHAVVSRSAYATAGAARPGTGG